MKSLAVCASPLISNVKIDPPPFGKYFLYTVPSGFGSSDYRRMMYFLYLWMIVQVLNNFQCILYMTLYTKRQCLKSLQEDE